MKDIAESILKKSVKEYRHSDTIKEVRFGDGLDPNEFSDDEFVESSMSDVYLSYIAEFNLEGEDKGDFTLYKHRGYKFVVLKDALTAVYVEVKDEYPSERIEGGRL